MQTLTRAKTLTHQTARSGSRHAVPPRPSDRAERARPLREEVALCAGLARLLRRSLSNLDWAGLPAADRLGLEDALSGLAGDIPLIWLIRSQAAFDDGLTVEAGMIISGADWAATTGGRSNEQRCEERRKGRAAEVRDTAKAAPAASPSRKGIESSDGDAAFPGHPAPAAEPGRRQGGPMRRESVTPDAAPRNDRCAGATGRRGAIPNGMLFQQESLHLHQPNDGKEDHA